MAGPNGSPGPLTAARIGPEYWPCFSSSQVMIALPAAFMAMDGAPLSRSAALSIRGAVRVPAGDSVTTPDRVPWAGVQLYQVSAASPVSLMTAAIRHTLAPSDPVTGSGAPQP